MKSIVILGSTGSIGTQTLDVVRAHPGEFRIVGLSAHENTELFAQQVKEFAPRHVLITSVSEDPEQALMALATLGEADLIVNALGGYAGFMPTYVACKAGKRIALANKESLVLAGELIMQTAQKFGAEILPIDSEPSAIWQAIRARGDKERLSDAPTSSFATLGLVEKIILTASGGPFWKFGRPELERVTVAQALKHPTWKMGERISIDSATLMNKAFEIIESRWLFDISASKIDVTIHRQSIVHALVQFVDGNTTALLSPADMRIPISHALFYPDRRPNSFPRLDFSKMQLTFETPDYSVLEGPRLAYEMLKAGGIMPAALCIADEIAVGKFLKGEISFLGIYDFIKKALDDVRNEAVSMESIVELKQKSLSF